MDAYPPPLPTPAVLFVLFRARVQGAYAGLQVALPFDGTPTLYRVTVQTSGLMVLALEEVRVVPPAYWYYVIHAIRNDCATIVKVEFAYLVARLSEEPLAVSVPSARVAAFVCRAASLVILCGKFGFVGLVCVAVSIRG